MDLQHARGDALDQVAVVGDQQHGAGVVGEGRRESLDGVDVEVVRGLVQDEEVGVAGEQPEEAQPAALAARELGDGLVDLVGGEQEAAQQAAGDLLVVAGERQHRFERRGGLVELAALLREVGEAHVVAEVRDAVEASVRRPTMVSARVVLPEPFGPSSATFSPRSMTDVDARARAPWPPSPEPTLTAGVFISITTRADGAGCGSPRCRRRASRARRLHVALDALDLGELRLGLLGLELLGVEAVVEALELLDLLFVLLVAAGDQVVARGALAHVGREVAADRGHDAVLEGQHA